MPEAVIFDWDGTLADTRNIIVASFQKVLKQKGCNVTDAFIERQIGIGTKNTFKEASRQCGQNFDETLIQELVERKVDAAVGLSDSVKLFPGARDLLTALSGRKRLALASMNNRRVIDKMLEVTAIREYFDLVLTADEVKKPKPDPEIFLRCASELGVKLEQCVVLEDSIYGVEAAKAGQMKCIAVTTGAFSEKELASANPDLIVKNLKEKEKILELVLGSRISKMKEIESR